MKKAVNELIGDKNPISNILKCINQAIIAPVAVKLKFAVMNHINYKDGRNRWFIDINLGDSVKIVHKKVYITFYLMKSH